LEIISKRLLGRNRRFKTVKKELVNKYPSEDETAKNKCFGRNGKIT
jgi:hypothetical protein